MPIAAFGTPGAGGADVALESYADLKSWVLSQADEETDGSSDFNEDADQALLEAWTDLYVLQPWLCLLKFPPGALLLPAPITGLSLTAVAGETGGTIAPLPGSLVDLTNWIFLPDGKPYLLRVTTHDPAVGGNTHIVQLDVVPESLTAQAGIFVKLDHQLPVDVGVFKNGLWQDDGRFIAIRGEEDLRKEYPDRPTAGDPVMAARVAKRWLRMSHYVERSRRVEFPYATEPDSLIGATEISIDQHLRPILANLAVHHLLLMKSDDKRAQRYFERAELKTERAIVYEHRLETGMGRLNREVRPGPYSHGRMRGTRRRA